jgi:uncharacterized protein (TIGR02118 family)
MARMLVIYRTPKDPKVFDEHYLNVHVPMAKKFPGLIKYETSVGPIVGMSGARDTYFIAILHFESLTAIKAAFATELGKACAADRRVLAPNDEDVEMFLFADQTA